MPSVNQIKDFFMFWRKRKKDEPIAFKDIPIIQLGIGGAPSSGKTVLIDALFRLMGPFRPSYVADTNLDRKSIIELVEVDDELFGLGENTIKNLYEGIQKLNQVVTANFHSLRIQTEDEADKEKNTYKALLKKNGRPFAILLIRNMSGEMFNNFFSKNIGSVVLKVTLNDYFDIYKGRPDTELISFEKRERSDGHDVLLVENFFEFVKSEELKNGNDVESIRPFVKKFFFSYYFFKTSKYFVYAIDAVSPRTPNELVTIYRVIEAVKNAPIQSFYAITKFDKFFKDKRIINNENLDTEEKDSYRRDLLEMERINNKDDYWKVMSFVYRYTYALITKEGTEETENKLLQHGDILRGLFDSGGIPPSRRNYEDEYSGNIMDNVFFVTAAYNDRYQFIPFKDDYEGESLFDFSYWNEGINQSRMSLGVLELWLRLLHEMGFELRKLKVLPSRDEKYNEIIKKITGIPKTS